MRLARLPSLSFDAVFAATACPCRRPSPVHASDTATRRPRPSGAWSAPSPRRAPRGRRGRSWPPAPARRSAAGVGTGVTVGSGVAVAPGTQCAVANGSSWLARDRVAAAVAARLVAELRVRRRSAHHGHPPADAVQRQPPHGPDRAAQRRRSRTAARRRDPVDRQRARASRAPPPRSRARPPPDGVQLPRPSRAIAGEVVRLAAGAEHADRGAAAGHAHGGRLAPARSSIARAAGVDRGGSGPGHRVVAVRRAARRRRATAGTRPAAGTRPTGRSA